LDSTIVELFRPCILLFLFVSQILIHDLIGNENGVLDVVGSIFLHTGNGRKGGLAIRFRAWLQKENLGDGPEANLSIND
jgi:hypothetical protein